MQGSFILKNVTPHGTFNSKAQTQRAFHLFGKHLSLLYSRRDIPHASRPPGKSAEVVADSAGLIDYHEGELPDSRMRAHAARHGYQLTHRSRPVRHGDFSKFDLIVAMDERNREKLLRIAQTDEERRKVVMMTSFLQHHSGHAIVPDPYYGGDEDFELVIELLEDACQGLLDHLTQG